MITLVFKAEVKKSQHTFASWMTVIGAFFVPVVCFLIYLFRWRYFIPSAETNAWDTLSETVLSLSTGLLFPFLVIVFVAANLNLENKADSWKKLYVIPVRRETLFWGKLLFLALQVLVCLFLLFLCIPLTGLILGLIHPELAFLTQSLDVIHLLTMCLFFYVSMLGILSIQYLLSLLFKNIIIPITIGMMMIIVSMVLVEGWEYIRYDPYAFPFLLSRENRGIMGLPLWFGLPMTTVLSLAYFFVVSICTMRYFKRRTVK